MSVNISLVSEQTRESCKSWLGKSMSCLWSTYSIILSSSWPTRNTESNKTVKKREEEASQATTWHERDTESRITRGFRLETNSSYNSHCEWVEEKDGCSYIASWWWFPPGFSLLSLCFCGCHHRFDEQQTKTWYTRYENIKEKKCQETEQRRKKYMSQLFFLPWIQLSFFLLQTSSLQV